jgi:hypothetical protein
MGTINLDSFRTMVTGIITVALITPSCMMDGTGPQPDSISKYEPPGNKILVFIGQQEEDIGGNIYPLESFGPTAVDPEDPFGYGYIEKMVEAHNAPMPGGISIYNFLQMREGEPFLATGDYLERVADDPRFDNTAYHLSLGMAHVNEQVAAGMFDAVIGQLGDKIASYQRPVYLRIGYEFDNVGHGNPDPEVFKTAWRRIVDVLHANGVNNFATVFSSIFLFESVPFLTNCDPGNPLDCYRHEDYYPGDAYVDWMGASFWFGPGMLLDSRCLDMLNFARRKDKPVMLSETAPMFADLKLNWLEPIFLARFELYFDFLERNREQIKAIHYINDHWQINPYWGEVPIYQTFANMDSRLHVNSKVRSLWLEKMAQTDIYLNAHENLFNELGYPD